MRLAICAAGLLAACGPRAGSHKAAVFCPNPAEPLAADVVLDDTLVHRATLEVTTGEALGLEIACSLDGDPDEVHRLSAPAACRQPVHIDGLLADSRYLCSISTPREEIAVTVDTLPLPDGLPTWHIEENGSTWGAYNLVNHAITTTDADPEQKLLIIDNDGRLRWHYKFEDSRSRTADAQYLGDGRILTLGAVFLEPKIIDLGHNTHWTGPPAEYHHHAEMLSEGILTMTTAQNTNGLDTWQGFAVWLLDPDSDQSLWSWNSQSAVDNGILPPPDDDEVDPYHANALAWANDDEGPALWVNLYTPNQILRISRESREASWILGADGDFQLFDETGAPSQDWFDSAHAPELHLPKVLLYDNGNDRPGGIPYSRILELEVDQLARTARISWQWTEDDWFEPLWGDVDQLENGNVFITRGHCLFCTPGQVSQLLEVDRVTEEVVWRLAFDSEVDGIYRAERIDGCALFDNSAYCEDLR